MQRKNAVGLSLLAVGFAFVLPLVLSGAPAESREVPELTPPAVTAAAPTPTPTPEPEPVCAAEKV